MANGRRRFIVFLFVCTVFSILVFRAIPEDDTNVEPVPELGNFDEDLAHSGFDQGNLQTPLRIPTELSARRILVTGGGGNIGKQLVRRLLLSQYSVTVIDLVFQPSEHGYPEDASIAWIEADIRNSTALDQALTSDVVGVVHLAAVSRVFWCFANEPDCMDINVQGTGAILSALERKSESFRPWFILASSRAVYARNPTSPDVDVPSTIYGFSKLKAEQRVQEHARHTNAASNRIFHATILRLSSVYGSLYDHKDRLVSAFVSRALAHQTLQIIGGQQEIDFLHIHDCIDAFILAVARLEHKTKKAARSQVLVEIFDVTGSKATVRQLLDKVLVLTRSKSPIQTLPQDNRFSMHYLEESVTLLPEYTAKIRLDSGLIRLVGLYLKKSVAYLEQKVEDCASDSPPHVVANRDLLKLHGCTANLLMAVEGQIYSLAFDRNPKRQEAPDDMGPGTPDDYGSIWVVSELIIPDLLKVHIESRDGKLFVQLQAVRDYAAHVLGIYSPSLPEFARGFVFDHVELEDIGSDRAVSEWEIIINEQDGAFKLVLPDSGYQVFPPRRYDGWFSWIDVEADVYSFRLIPICCPSPPPLPFYEQDPIQHSIHFDRYSKERPFDKTIPQTLCLRAKAALARVQDAIEYLDDVSRAGIPPNTRFMGNASGWVNKELLACTNDCNHPTICMDTDDCACVEALFCPPPQRFPFLHRLGITYPPLDDRNSSLPEIVEQTSWMSVLRPEAARYLSTDPSWPSVHIAAVDTASESLRGPRLESVARLLDRDCFSADASMEMGLRGRGRTLADQADIIFQPYYHARMWTDEGETENLLDQLESNYPNHAGQVAIPLTYDWGLCLFFTWTIWDVRIRLSIPSALKNVFAWSVMGDLNSPCYRPHQDILIPPRSCRTRELRPAFSDPARIGALVDRTYLAFFHGTTWGQGGTLRRKLVCNRPLPNQGLTRFEESRVGLGVGHLPLPRPKWDKPQSHDDYVSILNSTIFCAVPPGVAGWAPRIEDAIFAGCIPVMFDDTSHLPFWELLDWSKFSVRVFTHEVQYLEEILMSYSMQEIQHMQANLLHVRDILMYPLDDEHEDMLVPRSPLSFALHQTQLRLLTRWPVSGPEF